jgi:MFS transporter, DHA3 family, macrolide efflux protein
VLAKQFFRRLWIAQSISVFGDYLAMFAVQAAIVFRMHGSAREVSGVLLASLIPAMALGPVAGVFADRWHPRRVMVTSDGLRAALVLLLACASRVSHGFAYICAICFAIGSVSVFFVPAQAVAIPLLVNREQLLAASALMQQTLQVARIASPAVAGALVTHFGENACYAADAASFVFSAAMLATLRCEPSGTRHVSVADAKSKNGLASVAREFREGAGYIFANPELSFATISMAAGTFAAGCFSALAAIYVRDVLQAGTVVYGAIGSLAALGTLAGSFAIGRVARHCERETLVAAGMGVVGASILLLAAFPAVLAATFASLGIGFGAAMALIAASAMLRERTPEELRGRGSSVSMSLMSAAQAGALLFAGSCAAWLGIRTVYSLSAAMLLAQPAYRYFRRGTVRSAPSACFQNPL